jgi:hypothetical protein
MLVIFVIFIVFKEDHGRKAEIIQKGVNVWPVQDGNNLYIGYHGHFNAEKFEHLFDTISHAVQFYELHILSQTSNKSSTDCCTKEG